MIPNALMMLQVAGVDSGGVRHHKRGDDEIISAVVEWLVASVDNGLLLSQLGYFPVTPLQRRKCRQCLSEISVSDAYLVDHGERALGAISRVN